MIKLLTHPSNASLCQPSRSSSLLLLPWLPGSLCWPHQDRRVIITIFTRFTGLSCQILMVDMQQRTSLGTFIEVTQFETQYYFWPKWHSTSQALAAKPLTKHMAGKESACNVGDLDLISGLGRYPGEGNGYPLQYSDLENSMDCIVHGVTKSRTQMSEFHFDFHAYCKKTRWLWRFWKLVFKPQIRDYELYKLNQVLNLSEPLLFWVNICGWLCSCFSHKHICPLLCFLCALRICCLLLTALPGLSCHLAFVSVDRRWEEG